MEPKRFYRSTTDKKIAGVAGGLGEYFDLDPLLIRLVFVILVFAGGSGVLIYFILWIITAEKPVDPSRAGNPSSGPQSTGTYTGAEPHAENQQAVPSTGDMAATEPRQKGSLVGGLVLITLGFIFLADEIIPGISFGDLWPIILVVIGIGLLVNSIYRR